MNYKHGRTTYATTGSKTITTTFQPVEVELVVTDNIGSAGSSIVRSESVTDGTNFTCDAFTHWSDTVQPFSERFTDRVASIWEWNGSAYAEVFKVTFTSWSATGVTLNVATANSSYQVSYKIRG